MASTRRLRNKSPAKRPRAEGLTRTPAKPKAKPGRRSATATSRTTRAAATTPSRASAGRRGTKVETSSGLAAIDRWIDARATGWQAQTLRALVDVVRAAAPSATAAIKWGQPVFEASGPFAYVRPAKAHVTFGFWRGQALADPDGLLDGAGQLMKHLKISAPGAFDRAQLSAWVKQAVALNARLGSPTQR